MPDWLVFPAILVVVVIVTLLIVRRDQERMKRESPEQQRREMTATVAIDVLGGAAVAALKFVWRWRHEPVGSLQRTAWMIVVCAAAAFALWLAVRFVDRRLNGPDFPAPGAGEAAVGDQIEQNRS